MPFVTIRYGPYLSYGIIDHRVQKINGLFGDLDQLGYEIEVIQINEYNRLTIEMYDREVFRCDIRNLMFNMPVEDDPVCQRAVKAVEEAKFRMCTDGNIPGYTSYSKGRRDLQAESPHKSSIQNALPSNTHLLYEIPAPDYLSNTKKISVTDESTPNMEEKTGKVKIMEDIISIPIEQDDTNEN